MAVNNERALQLEYWKEHSVVLSLEAMMLDSQASKLDAEERPEILSLLPPLEGMSVIELGAGIGRYTAELAEKADNVLAMDFIESAIKKNEETNGHFKNVKFMCADVTSPDLKIEPGSADLVFSNWLLMYLSDEEVIELAKKMLQWVKMGGYIFFRESCFHQSGDHKRKANPTHYREPSFYLKAFKECLLKDVSGNLSELFLVGCKCVGAYVRNKKNQNQICWLWQKISSADDKGFQQFLDNVQYTLNGILRYERIFGEGFVSTGGIETTKEFVDKLELKAGQKVLDVGCGIGGGDFYMADTFEVEVTAIDLSINMISFALERAIGRRCAVEFEVSDCTKREYPEDTFDVIYSRDTILHIQDKPALFQKFYKWLKPGGRLLISDYCKAHGTASLEFHEYIKQRGYDLHDVDAYGQGCHWPVPIKCLSMEAGVLQFFSVFVLFYIFMSICGNLLSALTLCFCSYFSDRYVFLIVSFQSYNILYMNQMLRNAGFDNVVAEDRTDQFIKILQRELSSAEKDKDAFICDFSEEDYASIIDGWKAKLKRTSQGEQKWGLFLARKDSCSNGYH